MLQIPNPPPNRQPVLNLPKVVAGVVGLLLGIHLIRATVLSDASDLDVILAFAFIPLRVTDPAALAAMVPGGVLPGGEGARLWTFVTYAFLHGDWMHVGFNCLWLTAFGSPLAWRFGAARFLAFSAAGAIGGALLQLALHSSDPVPMVGASAAISAHMAAACRFVFAAGGPLAGFQLYGPAIYRRPAAPLMVALRDRQVLLFLGVWFGLNIVFGLPAIGAGLGASGAIAWEAHVGGFITGLLLFSLFDPVRPGLPPAEPPPLDDIRL